MKYVNSYLSVCQHCKICSNADKIKTHKAQMFPSYFIPTLHLVRVTDSSR